MPEFVAALQPRQKRVVEPKPSSLSRAPRGPASRPNDISRLHRAVGNPTRHQLLYWNSVQPKLRVGPIDDESEREANRVADQVTRKRGPSPEISRSYASPPLQRACAECQKRETLCSHCEEELQRRPAGTASQSSERYTRFSGPGDDHGSAEPST